MPKSKSVRKGKSVKNLTPEQQKHRKDLLTQARLRKELRNDPIWDTCTQTYLQCVELLKLPQVVGLAAQQEGVAEHIKDRAAVQECLEILIKDNKDLSERLLEIYKKHEHKKGQPKDIEDAMAALEIQQNYMYWMELHGRTVTLTFNEIMEALHQAELAVQRKVAEYHAQVQAQDPNDTSVIDVQVKDVAAV